MSKINRFLKTSSVYFLGSILSRLMSFFLLPLYTSKLSPEQFGSYDLTISILSFAIPIVFFQIWDGMFRYSIDRKEDSDKFIVVTNAFAVWLIGLVIFSLSFWLTKDVFQFKNEFLIFCYGIFFSVQNLYSFVARSFYRNKLFVFSGLINSLITTIINIVLIINFNIGIESLFIAPIIGTIFQVIIIEYNLKPLKNLRPSKIDVSLQIEMIRFSIPLCIATVSYWLLSGYTRIVISQQLGVYSNGLFAVANKFTSLIALIISVFQYAWNELLYITANEENKNYKYSIGFNYIFVIILIFTSILMLSIKLVFPFLVYNSYFNALEIIPLSIIGVSANAFSGFIGTFFLAEKQTMWILWTTIISALINIFLLNLLTPIWGLQGAIGALAISFIVLALIRIYSINKRFNIRLSKPSLVYLFIVPITVLIFYKVNNIYLLIIYLIILSGIFVFELKDLILPYVKNEKGRIY